jgi:hypothetical protein
VKTSAPALSRIRNPSGDCGMSSVSKSDFALTFGSIEIRNNLRDPIERCMSIVAGAYPVELNGDLHEDVSFDL